MTKNWKTTLSGMLAAIGFAFTNDAKLHVWGIMMTAAGLLLLGKTAADNQPHHSPPGCAMICRKLSLVSIWVILLALVLIGSGCGTLSNLGSKPPSALESKLFTVQTNVVQSVVWQTNTVVSTNFVTVTNATGTTVISPVVSQNPVVLQTTNYATNYQFTPNATAGTVATTGAMIGTPFGFGGVAAAAIGGLFSLYAGLRSRTSGQVAGTLAQSLQVAQGVIEQLPNGAATLSALESKLDKLHISAGMTQDIASTVDKFVDPVAADAHAAAVVAAAQPTITAGNAVYPKI